jgi:hypothetical protein
MARAREEPLITADPPTEFQQDRLRGLRQTVQNDNWVPMFGRKRCLLCVCVARQLGLVDWLVRTFGWAALYKMALVKCLPGVRSGGRLGNHAPTRHRLPLPVGQPTSKRIGIKECSPVEVLDDPVVGVVTMSDGADRQCPIVTMPDFGRGQSVADACKGTRVPQERREASNPHYLPGAGEGSSELATPFHPSGDGSPGAPDGGGRGGGPPHSSPRSPLARRVAAYRRLGSSTAPDVSAGSRAIWTVRTHGRFKPPS